jgi:dihydroorotate dehydrogenase
VAGAQDALACLDAGATTVQIYSALIFEGPGVVGSITHGLTSAIRARDGARAAA